MNSLFYEFFYELFSEKDQLMHEGDKATFPKLRLMGKTDLTDNSQDIDIDTVVLMEDGFYDNAHGQKEIIGGIS